MRSLVSFGRTAFASRFHWSSTQSLLRQCRNISMEARKTRTRPTPRRKTNLNAASSSKSIAVEPRTDTSETKTVYYTQDNTESGSDSDSDEHTVTDSANEHTNVSQSADKVRKLLPEIRKPITATGEYLYGPNAIISALKARKRAFFHRLYVAPIAVEETDTSLPSKRKQNYDLILSLCDELEIPVEVCSKKEINYFVSRGMHQGFVLDCDALSFANVSEQPLPLSSAANVWLMLDHLYGEENVGGVLRSALFFGVDGCVYPTKQCAPLSSMAATASSGALDGMDIRLCSQPLHEYLRELKRGNEWYIVALDVSSGNSGDEDKFVDIRTSLSDFKLKQDRPTMIVIGNEAKGIAPQIKEECDELIYIEGHADALHYDVDSLNVANACSVALYQIMKNM